MSKAPLQCADTATGLINRIVPPLFRAGAALALLLAASMHGHAQQNGRGMTPPGLAPGSPVGSYSLSGFENVNLFNGNLNFNLPLLKIGGRGRVGASINLAVNSVKWDMSFRHINGTTPTQPFRLRGYDETDYRAFDFTMNDIACAMIAEGLGTPAFTCGGADDDSAIDPFLPTSRLPAVPQTTGYAFFPVARPDWVKWDFLSPGYGPGVMRGSRSEAWEQYLYPSPTDPRHNDPHYHKSQTLYRMKFVEPDGTEHEFIDTYTGGKPTFHSYAPEDDVKRGRVFVSTDGSAMTFVASAVVTDNSGDPSGELFFPDGTRCHVAGGLIKSVRDPDGNYVTYSYGSDATHPESLGRVVEIRDSLGRRVTITYGDQTNVWYDEIKYNGFGGELNRSIKVWHSRLADALRSDQTLKTIGQLFPRTSRNINLPAKPYNPVVTSAVELPDQRQYRLRYNSYGAMALVELPTGAAIKYNYADPVVSVSGIMHRIKERLVSTDGADWEQKQDFAPEYSVGANNTTEGWGTVVKVETHDLKNGGDRLVSRERHYFHGHPLLSTAPQLFYPAALDGREYQTERLNTEGTERVLSRTKMEWRQRETPVWWQSFTQSTFQLTPSNAPPRDPRVVTSTTSIEPYAGGANLVSKQTSVDPSDASGNTVGFDQFNNRTDLWEYDFGTNGQAGPLLRHTYTRYVQTLNVGGADYDYACATVAACGQTLGEDGVIRFNGDPESVIHMRGLPEYTEVRVPTGSLTEAVVSRSVFEYDEPSYTGDDHYGMMPADFPGWAAPLSPARGHLTTAKMWLDTLGGYQDEENAYLKAHTQYDRFGNAVKSWDARGNTSELKFSPAYKYALPTEAVSADPDGAAGPLTPLTTSTVYDFASGLVTDTFDANGQQTHAEYEVGVLDRLKKLYRPDGGWTEYEYGDQPGNLYLRTRMRREAGTSLLMTQDGGTPPAEQATAESFDKVLSGYQFFDGLGRAVRSTSRTGESSWAATATEYDGVGRVVKVSNPYEASDYAGAVTQDALWTTTDYDELGRAWKVTTPDGAKVITHFDGLSTLVTDQARNQRLSKIDALGRMREVWEVRAADATTGTEAVSFPHYADVPDVAFGYKTSYAYDVLGNLRKVEQGAQRRYFAYDSLSRLLRAKNPEQDALSALQLPAGLVSPLSDNNNGWSLKYEYDEAGNLKRKTDTRGISTGYTYDALNRPTFRDYSDSTPDVTYTYGNDPVANTKGRLTSVGSSVSTYIYTSYDVMGRVTASAQTTVGQQPYTMGYAYDLAGNLKSETYPSGRVVETQYDEAGQIAGVKKSTGSYYAGGDPSVTNNPNIIGYAAHGGVAALRLGNGLWEHTSYNNRLKPERIRLGVAGAESGVLQLDYGYGGADNNGNLMSQTITVPASGTQLGLAATQVYTYDALNRLESAREATGAEETWRQTYSYDRYGNRTLAASQTTLPKLTAPGQTAQPAVASPSIQAATNRVAEDQNGDGTKEYTFDKAGNLTCEARYCGAATTSPYYEYDAENRLKTAGGGPSVGGSSYVYDGDGRRVKKVTGVVVVVFVYNVTGLLVAEYGGDQMQEGGTRYVTQDHLGSTRVVTGQQGEVRGRYDYMPFGEEISAGRAGYGGSNIRQKFTRKERDNETGLDFFGARYYGPALGRFTSCDPAAISPEHLADPQRWNLFVYVENNPLVIIDPDGRDGEGQDGKKTITVFLNYTTDQLHKGFYDKQGRKHITKYLDTPNWEGLKKVADKNGYNLVVNYSTRSGVEHLAQYARFTDAVKNSEVVAVGPHAGASASGVRDHIPLNDFSAVVAPNTNYPFTFQNKGELGLSAKVLAVFGCDSDKLPVDGMFKPSDPASVFVGVRDSQGDGFSSAPGGNWAAYNFIKAYITKKGSGADKLRAAVGAAQTIYDTSDASSTITVNGKKSYVLLDKGDRVTSRKIE